MTTLTTPEGTSAEQKGGESVPVHVSQGPSAIKLFAIFAVTALLGASVILATNVIVNPRSEFPGHRFQPLVVDEPAIRLDLYKDLDMPPRTVIMGSSRATRVPPAEIDAHGHGPTFNFANSALRIWDERAIYRYLVAHHEAPKEIVYAVDIHALQAGHQANWRTRVSPEFGPYTGQPIAFEDHVKVLLDSFTWSYLKDDLKVMLYSLKGFPDTPNFAIQPDGHVIYPLDDARKLAGTYPLQAELDRTVPQHLDGYADEVGEEAFEALRTFVAEARANGTTMRMYFPPFHPQAYDALMGTAFPQARAASLEKVASLCGPGIHFFDFTQIDSFGGDPDGFYDDWHADEENARRILDRIYGQAPPDLCASDP